MRREVHCEADSAHRHRASKKGGFVCYRYASFTSQLWPMSPMIFRESASRFLIVGCICYLLNFIVLFISIEVAHLHYLPAMLISILSVNAVGWWLNRTWTFGIDATDLLGDFLRYIMASTGSMLSGLGIMVLMVSMLGVHPLAANAFVAAIMVLVNFFLHRNWSFRKKPRFSGRGKHAGGD